MQMARRPHGIPEYEQEEQSARPEDSDVVKLVLGQACRPCDRFTWHLLTEFRQQSAGLQERVEVASRSPQLCLPLPELKSPHQPRVSR